MAADLEHSSGPAEYTFSGQNAVLTYWHRPLHAMTAAFTEAGFQIAVISEPPPHQAPVSVSTRSD